MIPYGKQHVTDDDIAHVVDVLKSDYLTQGPMVGRFEERVARYHHVKYAVAFSNGTAALHGAYFAAGVTLGSEVITTPLTFAATANAVLYLGATPVFVDVEKDGCLMDISKIVENITDKTRCIAPVSYAGSMIDIEKIRKIIPKHCTIIHDAAHAIGAKNHGREISRDADMTILSFHPVKHITTGEGGMVLTSSKEYYEKLIQFRTHGISKNPTQFENESDGPWYHEMQFLGYNYRMSDINAALGFSQIKRLDDNIIKRNAIARYYCEKLATVEEVKLLDFHILTPQVTRENLDREDTICSFHLFVIKVSKQVRRGLFEYLHKAGVAVQVHYIPVHLHPYYQHRFGYKLGDYPEAEKFYQQEISLPMFPELSISDVDYVVETIKNFFKS